MKRHLLTIQTDRMEIVEHSHGRESSHAVKSLVCDQCGPIVTGQHYGFGRGYKEEQDELRLREIDHNLNVVLDAIMGDRV